MEIEGLTGEVKFNDEGKRQNYTLHVVEMTVNSAMVKVIIHNNRSPIQHSILYIIVLYKIHIIYGHM